MTRTLILVAAAIALAGSAHAQNMPPRHEIHQARIAKHPHCDVVAATFFGTECEEEFVAAGHLDDGTIVAMGNAWGPAFPDVEHKVVGKGEWYEVYEYESGYEWSELGRRHSPEWRYPNRAGMVVQYTPDMRSVKQVWKFDWGLATIEKAVVAHDGDLILIGLGTYHFREYARTADEFHRVQAPKDRKRYGPLYYKGVKMPGDVYVAKISADGSELRWVWLFEGYRNTPDRVWADAEGGVTFEIRGEINRISLGGDDRRVYPSRGGGHWLLAVHPVDGSFVRGGDYNSGTGREPWRRPVFACYDRMGEQRWKIWDWEGRLVGMQRYRLVSDSSARRATFDAPNDEVLVYGWSDGGNSVFTRQATDLEKGAPKSATGMSLWGAQVASFGHIMRVDLENLETVNYGVWTAYLPRNWGSEQGRPNGLNVNEMLAGPGGAMAMRGGSATGLVQTPNAFYDYPYDIPTYKYGGNYVTVFSRNLKQIHFSSYTPGCHVHSIGTTRDGFVFASRSTGDDGKSGRPTKSPIVNALQEEFGGGRYDGHLIVLRLPAENAKAKE